MRPFPRPLLPMSLLLTALAGIGAAQAATTDYAIDPVHTRVAFQISHAGFSNPIGSFSGSHGSLRFDELDWSTAQIDVVIPLATLDLGDADWQKKVLDPTFFNAKKFPEAHFVSRRVEKTGNATANITGELTLHGVTRPVVLAVTMNALKRHPLTLRKTAGFSATATISRKDFAMDAWRGVVGDSVRLIIEVEATRSGRDTDAQEHADADQK